VKLHRREPLRVKWTTQSVSRGTDADGNIGAKVSRGTSVQINTVRVTVGGRSNPENKRLGVSDC
jgi:hypothetical protein